MWCLPNVDAKFIDQMNGILDLYARPYNPAEPVVCLDEVGKQLLEDIRPPLALAPRHGQRVDYHYKRNGNCNIFVGVEPKGGWHQVEVTQRKKKEDYAAFVAGVVAHYPEATKVHVVADNFRTHSIKNLRVVLGQENPLLERIELHYTPVHASWLNMAELEASALARQCLKRRMKDISLVREETRAWNQKRNKAGIKIEWTFTRDDAKKIFKLEALPI